MAWVQKGSKLFQEDLDLFDEIIRLSDDVHSGRMSICRI
jgi:hypothetical protein